MTTTPKQRMAQHCLGWAVIAPMLALNVLTFSGPAAAESGTKLYRSLPSTEELSHDLFGPKPPLRTRGIRWQGGEAGAVDTTQSASLDPVAPAGEKLAFNIQFSFDSTKILTASIAFVDRLGEVLNAPDNLGRPLMIVGHTDASGAESYNWHLSQARAVAIRDYLVGVWNVDPATLAIDARGESEPLNGFSPFDATNRRVEFWALNG